MLEMIMIDKKGVYTTNNLQFEPGQSIIIGKDDKKCDIVTTDPTYTATTLEIMTFRGMPYARLLTQNVAMYVDGRQVFFDQWQPITSKSYIYLYKEDNESLIYFGVSTRDAWTTYPITKPTTIGSDDNCEIQLLDRGIAPQHFEVSKTDKGISCHIFQGAGIYVNGQFASHDGLLHDMSILKVGNKDMIVVANKLLYKAKKQGVPIEARNISKVVGKGKKILDNVSLSIEPCSFVTIVGGSGAGKSTLMNAISGLEPEFTGNVYIGGKDLVSNYDELKDHIGFVPQSDILYEKFGLQEMLENAAKLRMPRGTTKAKMAERVSEVIDIVDMKGFENTQIKKLSGGQKKRVSIALELLSDPKLFFLDEPTSGLDPGTEKQIMITLAQIAKEQKKTVVMVTHNVNNLDLCDKVIWMERGGRLAFSGSVSETKNYFGTDDLTDVYNTLAKDADGEFARNFRHINQLNHIEMATRQWKKRKTQRGFRQFSILLGRYTKLLTKDKLRMALLFLQPIVIGLLLRIVSDSDTFVIYENTKSMIFTLATASIWLGIFDTIQEICKERTIIKREFTSCLKMTPYILAKLGINMVIGLIQAILLAEVYFFRMKAVPSGIMAEVILTMWITIVASQCLGLALSAYAKSGDEAMTFAPFALMAQLLFSGTLFILSGPAQQFSRLTIAKWGTEALGSLINLNSLDSALQVQLPQLGIERGMEAIYANSIDKVLGDWKMMVILAGVFLIVAGITLTGIKKDRR